MPGVAVRFSLRWGGVSPPPFHTLNLGFGVGDNPAHVAENWRRLLRAWGAAPERLVQAEQVHGARVAAVDEADGGRGLFPGRPPVPGVDGLMTDRPGLILAMRFADCLPVALADPEAGRVALLHAGWRGLAAGILEEGVHGLVRRGARRERLVAALGPCIGPGYTLGPEARGRLAEGRPWARQLLCGPEVDLLALAEGILERQGIPAPRRWPAGERTDDLGRYFSHRREGGRTGRMVGAVWLEP